MKKITGSFLCLAAVLFFQCKKFDRLDDAHTFGPEPITTDIQGKVSDESGVLVSGVTIKVGDKFALTDENGYFKINAASLDKNSSLVTAEKVGYFKAFRTFAATSGTNQVSIRLIPKQLTGTISANNGGEVSLSNGTKVVLPADGIVTASNNTAYTGIVNVYMAYIDPGSAAIGDLVPGSFMANDKDGNRVTMLSYGMVAVDLESLSGQKLQLRSGSTATLTTAIPSVALASAPASIPLWSLDESTGIWKEEGSATRNGNVYTGQVSHFSSWNCDIGLPVTTIEMKLVDAEARPLVHVRVKVSSAALGWNPATYGITDSRGNVSGPVPTGHSLKLEVFDECFTVIASHNIGPFQSPADLGSIIITNTGGSLVAFSGRLISCSGTPVTSGFAIINVGNNITYANVDTGGNFSATIVRCPSASNNYTVTGVDNIGQQKGPVVSGTLSTPATAAGNVHACGNNLPGLIYYLIDGTGYSIGTDPGDSLFLSMNPVPSGGFNSEIFAYSVLFPKYITFKFYHNSLQPGTYPVQRIESNGNGSVNVNATVNISQFAGSPGQFIQGFLQGSYMDTITGAHTISATFKVRRN